MSNPSVCRTKGGEFLVNIRNLNYVLYHSEMGVHEHSWEPLCYLHKENDIMCRLDEKFDISTSAVVDTALLDSDPLWEFDDVSHVCRQTR